MNKLFWLSILGYFVGTMLTAYPWHIILFHDKYISMGAFTRGEPIMAFGMIAVLLQGVIFSYFYPAFLTFKKEEASIKNGVIYSLLMGVNVWTVMVFATAAKFKIEPSIDFILYGTAFQLIQFIVVGLILGVLHSKLSKTH